MTPFITIGSGPTLHNLMNLVKVVIRDSGLVGLDILIETSPVVDKDGPAQKMIEYVLLKKNDMHIQYVYK